MSDETCGVIANFPQQLLIRELLRSEAFKFFYCTYVWKKVTPIILLYMCRRYYYSYVLRFFSSPTILALAFGTQNPTIHHHIKSSKHLAGQEVDNTTYSFISSRNVRKIVAPLTTHLNVIIQRRCTDIGHVIKATILSHILI